jgi:hypothetical protein
VSLVGQLLEGTRSARSEAFTGFRVVASEASRSPAISADGLTYFAHRSMMATRPAIDGEFGEEVAIPGTTEELFFLEPTNDGLTLYASRDNRLVMLSRDSTDAPFGIPSAVDVFAPETSPIVTSPAISADCRQLVFSVVGNGSVASGLYVSRH